MKQVCAAAGDRCIGKGHADYEQALGGGTPDSIALVTLLRDPVERTLSEFFFMRERSGCTGCPHQRQWDFMNETFLGLVQDEEDVDKALDIYLHGWPEQPSFNRQVLYLAGFKGNGRTLPFRWTGGEQQQREFLSLAKQHLADVYAFGITDCYVNSVATMARTLGWNESLVRDLATNTHKREQQPDTAAADLKRHKRKAGHGEAAGITAFARRWRTQVSPSIVEEIERLNWADMELHRFALEQFRSRFGQECV